MGRWLRRIRQQFKLQLQRVLQRTRKKSSRLQHRKVTGKEQFRALAKSGEGSYKVTHKGQTIATFWLVDAEGKSVPCTAVALKQRSDDKKWAIDFEVADSEGLNIGAPIDRTYMFKTLGVSYVTINDTVIIDIEAEASAK